MLINAIPSPQPALTGAGEKRANQKVSLDRYLCPFIPNSRLDACQSMLQPPVEISGECVATGSK